MVQELFSWSSIFLQGVSPSLSASTLKLGLSCFTIQHRCKTAFRKIIRKKLCWEFSERNGRWDLLLLLLHLFVCVISFSLCLFFLSLFRVCCNNSLSDLFWVAFSLVACLMLWYFQVNKVTGRLKVVVWKFTRSPKTSYSISQVIATYISSSSSSLLPFFLVVSTQYV